jgi:spore coat protein U-like protein
MTTSISRNFRHSMGQAWRLGLIVGAIGLGQAATADTAIGPLAVDIVVSGACTVGASALTFPGASSAAIAAANQDATGNVTVNCTTGSVYTVQLGVGAGVGATLASRKMTAGAQLVNYSIYTTAGRTTVWGDGTAGSATVGGTGNGADQSLPAYGRIFAGQTVPAASYADTVNVTVVY